MDNVEVTMGEEEIPMNDVEIPMNDVEIPMNDIEVPMSDIEISVNEMEVPMNYIEVSTNDMKDSMNDIEVPMNEIEISVEEATGPMDVIEVTMHNLEVPELGASEIILDRIVQTKPAKSRYRYNTKWESNPLFAKWVQPVENDITKAYCTLCHAKLLARYNFLCKHRETFKHRKRDPNNRDKMMGKIEALPLFYSMPSEETDSQSQLKIIQVQTELDKYDNTKSLTVKRRLQRYVQVPTARKKLHIEPGWEGKMSIVTVPSPCCRNIKYIRSLTKENPKNLIPQLCKRFFKLGWLDGTGGGVSIKHNDLIYITPAGVQRDRIQPDELFCQTINNIDVEIPDPIKGLKKSQCTPLFVLFYKRRKAGAVIHTHSSYSALVTALWPQKEFCISHQEMIKGIRDPKLGRNLRYDEKLVVPIVENLQFEKDLEPSMGRVLNRYPGTSAILVRKHGLYVWGETWKSTKTMTECYENLFKIAVELKKIEPNADLCLRR